MSVQALRHIRLGNYNPLTEDKLTLLAVRMRQRLRHYCYFFIPPRSGMVKHIDVISPSCLPAADRVIGSPLETAREL